MFRKRLNNGETKRRHNQKLERLNPAPVENRGESRS